MHKLTLSYSIKHLLETTFDVSVNLTDFKWNDEFYNISSEAYTDLTEQLIEEVKLKPILP